MSPAKGSGLRLWLWCSVVVLSLAGATAPLAQGVPNVFKREQDRRRINSNLVGLITGSPGGKYMPLGTDLARLTDDRTGGELRLLVSFGYGSVQNVDDLLNLRGIDLAVVQGDVLDAFRSDPAQYAQLRQRMRYVIRLHQEEIHILARGNLRSVRGLDGKRVAIDVPGSGTQITARNLFDRLGIRPSLIASGPAQARDDLVAGRIDAMVYVVGRGASVFQGLSGEMALRAGLAFVPFAADEGNAEPYEPASLASVDYPALIPQGDRVPVRAVPSVLAVVAWPSTDARYGPVAKFVQRFFDSAAELGRRPGTERALWCQVDLAAPVAGWERFSAAAAWLDGNRGRPTRICDATADSDHDCYRRFVTAMSQSGVSVDLNSPFLRTLYAEWQRSSGRDCPATLVR